MGRKTKDLHLEKSSLLRQKAVELQKFLRKQQKAQLQKHRAQLDIRDKEFAVLKKQVAKQKSEIDCLRSENTCLQSQIGCKLGDQRKSLLLKIEAELDTIQKDEEQKQCYFQRLEREKLELLTNCFALFEKVQTVERESSPLPDEQPIVQPSSVQNPSPYELLQNFQFQILSKECFSQFRNLFDSQLDAVAEEFPCAIGFLRKIPKQNINLNLIREYFTLPNRSPDNCTLLRLAQTMRNVSGAGEKNLESRDSLASIASLRDLSSSLSEFSEPAVD